MSTNEPSITNKLRSLLLDDQAARDRLMLKPALAVSKAISQHRSEFRQDENEAGAEGSAAKPAPPIGAATPTRQEGHWARLQQDLNSPNAALRLRAIRALK